MTTGVVRREGRREAAERAATSAVRAWASRLRHFTPATRRAAERVAAAAAREAYDPTGSQYMIFATVGMGPDGVSAALRFVPRPDHAVERSAEPYDRAVARFSGLYGDQRGRFLAARLSRMLRRVDTSCLSHVRVALVGDARQEAEYEAVRASGCCASVSQVFEFWDRSVDPAVLERYRVGFNYGH